MKLPIIYLAFWGNSLDAKVNEKAALSAKTGRPFYCWLLPWKTYNISQSMHLPDGSECYIRGLIGNPKLPFGKPKLKSVPTFQGAVFRFGPLARGEIGRWPLQHCVYEWPAETVID